MSGKGGGIDINDIFPEGRAEGRGILQIVKRQPFPQKGRLLLAVPEQCVEIQFCKSRRSFKAFRTFNLSGSFVKPVPLLKIDECKAVSFFRESGHSFKERLLIQRQESASPFFAPFFIIIRRLF